MLIKKCASLCVLIPLCPSMALTATMRKKTLHLSLWRLDPLSNAKIQRPLATSTKSASLALLVELDYLQNPLNWSTKLRCMPKLVAHMAVRCKDVPCKYVS